MSLVIAPEIIRDRHAEVDALRTRFRDLTSHLRHSHSRHAGLWHARQSGHHSWQAGQSRKSSWQAWQSRHHSWQACHAGHCTELGQSGSGRVRRWQLRHRKHHAWRRGIDWWCQAFLSDQHLPVLDLVVDVAPATHMLLAARQAAVLQVHVRVVIVEPLRHGWPKPLIFLFLRNLGFTP